MNPDFSARAVALRACVCSEVAVSTLHRVAALLSLSLCTATAGAQDLAAADAPTALPVVVVTAEPVKTAADTPNETGSRLGLTPAETPATLAVITQEQMQSEGLRTLIEAYGAAPGVVAGNLPGEPGMAAIRGFSSGSAVTYLFDGMRASDSGLVSRNFDSFNFERVEILKGPASVVHGTGALAGAINLVTKKPKLGEQSVDALFSYGSFDSLRAGIGGNLPLGETVAVRGDLSYSQSSGYIDDTDARTTALTTGITFQPNRRLSLSASFDYFQDHYGTPYQGTPLLPANIARKPSGVVSGANGLVLDESIRDLNYNVDDGVMKSESYWLRTRVAYQLDDRWQLVNELGYYDGDRRWSNSEDFSYNVSSGLLDRTTTRIFHDHQFWSERAYASFDGVLGGLRNRLAVGVEYNDTEFATLRRFGATTSVDPFAPERGSFPADTPANFSTRTNFDSTVQTRAAFVENALNLTPAWLLVTGLRYEALELKRVIDDLSAQTRTEFGRDFEDLSWRLGTVYELLPSTQVYAQYNHAVTPVTSLLLSNLARAAFDLSEGNAIEAGVRSSFWQQRAVLTTALYRIEQDNILTRDQSNQTVQGGTRAARGVEVDLSLALTPRWQVEANAAVLKSEFTHLIEAGGADRAGKRPPNVPERVFNLSSSYRLEPLPLTVGAALRHVGDFYTDNANSYRVDGHTLIDASVAYRIGGGTLTLRGRNLSDEFYADWSGYSATQVYIGAPRSVDLSWSASF